MPHAPTAAIPVQGARPAASNTAARFTRDDLLALGRAGPPSRFLPLAAQALARHPHDAGVRFLFAARLAQAGLRTLAAEQLSLLPPEAGNSPDVVSLGSLFPQLPGDRADTAALRACCERNLAALADTTLTPHLSAWRESLNNREFFRRLDGALVSRPRGANNPSTWKGLAADADEARAAVATLNRPGSLFIKPLVLGGLGSPDHVLAAFAATERDSVGYTPRLSIVEPDAQTALDGLAQSDLSRIIADKRTEWFLGKGSIESFRAAWNARLGSALPESIITAPGHPCPPDLAPALTSLHEAQGIELALLHERVTQTYSQRSTAWWGRRYTAGEPLRILVLTSRFSTFVRHSAADLAGAFTRLGHLAAVHTEPDNHSRESTLGTLRAVAELEPDLVVLVNFQRSACGPGVPANVPFVCWVQDAMPHLLAPATDKGPLDFVVGHLLPEFFDRFGYSRENALPALIVADATKFHPGPADASPCEIALVSHHSEPPEAMHARLVREAGNAPAIARVFSDLLPDIRAAVAAAADFPVLRALRDCCTARLREALGREPEPRTLALVLRTFAAPLADRLLRHETIAWAAEAARTHNWRLRLYGRGWEQHPGLAQWAAGPLDHGEALRAAYQSAALNLHISLSTLVHQRVLECFLSGGLCAARMTADALAAPKTTAQIALLARSPDIEEPDRIGYIIADHPEALHLASLRARLGSPITEPIIWINRLRAESMLAQGHTLARDHDLDTAIGDMAAVTFRSAAELESLARRAIDRPNWRAAVSHAASARIRRSLTHDALATRLLDFLTRRLNGQPA